MHEPSCEELAQDELNNQHWNEHYETQAASREDTQE